MLTEAEKQALCELEVSARTVKITASKAQIEAVFASFIQAYQEGVQAYQEGVQAYQEGQRDRCRGARKLSPRWKGVFWLGFGLAYLSLLIWFRHYF